MSSINDRVVFCISKLKVIFSDQESTRTFQGTGFWIEHRGRPYIVTNRHNVDPNLKYEGAGYTFVSIQVELRKWVQNSATQETRMFTIHEPTFFIDEDADCCLIDNPRYDEIESFHPICLPSTAIADSSWFEGRARLMDRVFFIGYPLSPTGLKPWWDTGWGVPIAREASIASLPFIEFENPLVQTSTTVKISDIILVSGHSFGGCSGSPVLHTAESFHLQEKDSRIIGIMSGHLGDKDRHDRAVHGGLSFFTRSTAIWRLLNRVV
ncbi:hypothetical protein [Nannocystis pusilla]|uniref:hypothetical protein n=1 Tax=Nannocystis pusilla TaxID=889268 RepID=UPI003BF023AD